MSEIRNRIRELRQVRAGELQANPANFREHGEYQTKVLQSVLDRIGYADALLAREDEAGVLWLIDGHLRASLDPEQMLPVLVLDVTAEEADELLATIDPIAALATINGEKLTALTESIRPRVAGDDVAMAFIDSLAGKTPAFEPVSSGEQPRLDQKSPITCPHCKMEFMPA